MAKSLEEIEQEVSRLTPEELREFRAWFEEFDAQSWDAQIEQDAVGGKLDDLANSALVDHENGRSRPL